MRTYSVELTVSGNLTVQRPINFDAFKELQLGEIFNSDISVKPCPQGVKISSTVFTESDDRALKVALLFVGRMLDVLAIKANRSLWVSQNDLKNTNDRTQVKAIISPLEFKQSFEIARELNLNQRQLLIAFNWYRKGLYAEDAFDKFLAFWNSISLVASAYHPHTARTPMGIINQIYASFELLWGTWEHWKFINADNRWINENNSIRDHIAHGLMPVEVHHIEDVLIKLESVQKVAYKFLTEWAQRQLGVDLNII